MRRTRKIQSNLSEAFRSEINEITSAVALLCPLDLKRPLVVLFVVRRLKSLIARVSVAADRKDVNVAMPNPRHCLVAQTFHSTAQISRLAWFERARKAICCYRQMAHQRFKRHHHTTMIRENWRELSRISISALTY